MKDLLAKLFVLALLAPFSLYGCAPQNNVLNPNPTPMSPNVVPFSVQTIQADQEFMLAPGQEAKLLNTDTSVYFLNVENDSRCASDVQCITAGTLTVSVNVFQNGKILNQYPLTLVVGGHQDMNDEYVLTFVKVSPERGKQSEEVRKSDYRATFRISLKHKPLPVPVTEINYPAGAIFPKESLPNSNLKKFEGIGIKTSGLWNPHADDAKNADRIVKNCVMDKQKTSEIKAQNYTGEAKEREIKFYLEVLEKIAPVYDQYIRQYIGYTGSDGHRLVWVNFFLPDAAKGWDWKKEIIQPPMTSERSADHSFFEALIDLNTQSCLYLKLGI